MTDQSTPGVPGRSALSVDNACKLLLDTFGIAGDLSELPSYEDQNFRVRTGNVPGEQNEFVFKISNSMVESEHLLAQGRAMSHLAEAGLPVPRLVPSISGGLTVTAPIDDEEHVLRLVTFLPGSPIAGANPVTNDLLFDLGVTLGQVDRSFESFVDPATHRTFEWDPIWAAETVAAHVEFVEGDFQRELLLKFCDRFNSHTAPCLTALPQQVIHGDANDHNVLVSHASGEPIIAGLIDFGDLIYSVRIGELAIAAAYNIQDHPDPIGLACSLIAGFHSVNPILEEELNVLEDLIWARLCVSVSVCAKLKRAEPNNEYLRVSERPGWDLLENLDQLPDRLALYRFREACGFEPFPGNKQLENWLANNAPGFAPLLNCDLHSGPCHVFDFSVGTLDWEPDDMMKPLVAWRRMQQLLDDSGAQVGIGRYDEPRLVYAGDQFGSDTAEMRTIHLGLDFFQPPGSPIFAPLDGTVFSVQNRHAPYDYGPVVVLRHNPHDGPEFYTLYGHLKASSITDLELGQTIPAGTKLAEMGTAEENGGWIPHLHFQIIGDMLDSDGEFIGVALSSQRSVWKSICPDPNLITGIPEDRFPTLPLPASDILLKRQLFAGPSLSLSYRKPLHFVRGFMQYLYQPDGTAYLDAVNNVPHVGHAHPRVVRALSRQMRTLNTNTRYLHQNLVEYSERLAATMPDPLSVVYLVNSGSEANDLALRMARAATGGRCVISVDGSYHGNLSSLIDISPYKHNGPGGSGTPATTHVVPMPDPYRGPHRGYSAESGAAYAQYVSEAATEAAASSDGLAAFICESALGCGGQIFLPEQYLRNSFDAVRAQAGVCIADEVQVGMCRLGSHFWGFESHGVVPDIVTIGKPVGNGHPLGAVVTTRAIAEAFDNGMEYFNTFGGNPASCAVGLAVLDILEEDNLQENARLVGAHLLDLFRDLALRHPIIGDVRGQGLFLGIELVLDRETLEPAAQQATYVVNRLRDNGILTSTDGPLHNVIKIKPPMVFTNANADRLATALDQILGEDFITRCSRERTVS